jgi:hypothetical protein
MTEYMNPDPGTERALVSVANERRRQIAVEGYARNSDDGYILGELAMAASCYARYAASRERAEESRRAGDPDAYARDYVQRHRAGTPGPLWPWSAKWWKPKTTREDLVRAAALLVAEIERIDRREDKRMEAQVGATLFVHATKDKAEQFGRGLCGGPVDVPAGSGLASSAPVESSTPADCSPAADSGGSCGGGE